MVTKCERHPEAPKEPRQVRDPFAPAIIVYECHQCDDENTAAFHRNRQAATPTSMASPTTS